MAARRRPSAPVCSATTSPTSCRRRWAASAHATRSWSSPPRSGRRCFAPSARIARSIPFPKYGPTAATREPARLHPRQHQRARRRERGPLLGTALRIHRPTSSSTRSDTSPVIRTAPWRRLPRWPRITRGWATRSSPISALVLWATVAAAGFLVVDQVFNVWRRDRHRPGCWRSRRGRSR